MATHAHNSAQHASPNQQATRLGMPLVAICALAVAGCMAFGNPMLWMTDDQVYAAQQEPAPTPDNPTPATPTPSNTTDPEPAKPSEQEVIGVYEAISAIDDPAREENLRLACEALNGTIIQPGETFSFNEVVGDTGSDERYQYAPVVVGEATVMGRGGGICQVSTALYIAALKANMQVVERHAHTIATDYSPIGLDATVVYGELDLRMKNVSNEPMVISAEALGQTVSITITGAPLPAGMVIDPTSRIVKRYEETADDGTVKEYYETESYRVVYHDGRKTDSVLLYKDTYLIEDEAAVSLHEGGVDPVK